MARTVTVAAAWRSAFSTRGTTARATSAAGAAMRAVEPSVSTTSRVPPATWSCTIATTSVAVQERAWEVVAGVAGEVEEHRDHLGHGAGRGGDLREVGADLRVGGPAQQGEVGGALDGGERGPQLVGELGGEPLLGPDGGGDPVEQVVEGLAQGGELVGGWAEVEAVRQVVLAPVRGPLRHLGDRRQRLPGHPQRDQGGRRDDEEREQRRWPAGRSARTARTAWSPG